MLDVAATTVGMIGAVAAGVTGGKGRIDVAAACLLVAFAAVYGMVWAWG